MGRRWTEEEKDYLADNLGIIPLNLMAEHLRRTPSSVRSYVDILRDDDRYADRIPQDATLLRMCNPEVDPRGFRVRITKHFGEVYYLRSVAKDFIYKHIEFIIAAGQKGVAIYRRVWDDMNILDTNGDVRLDPEPDQCCWLYHYDPKFDVHSIQQEYERWKDDDRGEGTNQ